MAEILLHMMEKSADARPQSIMEVCHQLLIHQQRLEKESLQKQIARVIDLQTPAPTDTSHSSPPPNDPSHSASSSKRGKSQPLAKTPDQSASKDVLPDVSPVDSFIGLPHPPNEPATPAQESGQADPALFPQALFQELVRELNFALADETTPMIESAFESTGTSRTTLKKDEFMDFTRALMKHVPNITQREKVRQTCEKIRRRVEQNETLAPGEECLSLLYMTQLRRLVKRLVPDTAFDIVDECIDILDLPPRKIPISRRDELLEEIEHQMGKMPLKKQFRSEVKFIALQ
ncbi:hypothetical protein QQ056_12940 [Oscillatoria laete-virens NRMC-F 0139]|nr:hypothetical protein [Oscillatoria laete-virens]MDL5054445.1 hypothetical protein [Oscillatoria laete-virens NRMC-F 0139]